MYTFFLILLFLISLPVSSPTASYLSEKFIESRRDFEFCLSALSAKGRAAFRDGMERDRRAGLSPHTRKTLEGCFEKMREMEDAKSAIEIRDALAGFFEEAKNINNNMMLKEAEEIARTLVETTIRLNKVYKMGRSALWHNFLIKVGAKEGGYCYQWVTDLLMAMPMERYTYFERHWGVHKMGKTTENNAIIITARGQPISGGIVYDPWRGKGRPFWRYISEDNQEWSVRWTEDEIISAGSDPLKLSTGVRPRETP